MKCSFDMLKAIQLLQEEVEIVVQIRGIIQVKDVDTFEQKLDGAGECSFHGDHIAFNHDEVGRWVVSELDNERPFVSAVILGTLNNFHGIVKVLKSDSCMEVLIQKKAHLTVQIELIQMAQL
jgi:hypothetical protein